MHWQEAIAVSNSICAVRRFGIWTCYRYWDETAELIGIDGRRRDARPGEVEGCNDWEPLVVGPRLRREHNAHASLLTACKAAEWGGQAWPMDESYQGCANTACPACGGINPNERNLGEDSIGAILYDWDEDAYGHRDDCKLKAAIEAAEPKGE